MLFVFLYIQLQNTTYMRYQTCWWLQVWKCLTLSILFRKLLSTLCNTFSIVDQMIIRVSSSRPLEGQFTVASAAAWFGFKNLKTTLRVLHQQQKEWYLWLQFPFERKWNEWYKKKLMFILQQQQGFASPRSLLACRSIASRSRFTPPRMLLLCPFYSIYWSSEIVKIFVTTEF